MGWSCGATRGRTSPPDRVRAIALAILCELLLAEKLTAFPCSSAPASNLPQRMLQQCCLLVARRAHLGEHSDGLSLLWVFAGNPGEVTRPELVKYLHEQWTPLVKEFCDEPGPDGDDDEEAL